MRSGNPNPSSPGAFPGSAAARLARFTWVLVLSLGPIGQAATAAAMETSGLIVEHEGSVSIPGIESSLAFQFNNGTIVVGTKGKCSWSTDLGQTWQIGPEGPSEKVAIDLDDGEVIALERNTRRREDDLFSGGLRRSLDNGATFQTETPVIDVPEAASTVLGGGAIIDGFLFHHGILKLNDGRLIASMYGNYRGDTMLCDGYPPELGQLKYRTIVVFSTDMVAPGGIRFWWPMTACWSGVYLQAIPAPSSATRPRTHSRCGWGPPSPRRDSGKRILSRPPMAIFCA